MAHLRLLGPTASKQTGGEQTATAFAWFSILKFAYPGRVKWRDILAGYAVSVALNGILPANIGTFVFLVMVTVLIGIGFGYVYYWGYRFTGVPLTPLFGLSGGAVHGVLVMLFVSIAVLEHHPDKRYQRRGSGSVTAFRICTKAEPEIGTPLIRVRSGIEERGGVKDTGEPQDL